MSATAGRVIRRIISTTKAPSAIGPYKSVTTVTLCPVTVLYRQLNQDFVLNFLFLFSQAVQVDYTLYISGQIGLVPEVIIYNSFSFCPLQPH